MSMHRDEIIDGLFDDWQKDIEQLIQTLGRPVSRGEFRRLDDDNQCAVFDVRWVEVSGEVYGVEHRMPFEFLATGEPSAIKANLATVTETIKRTLEEL